MTAPQTTPRTGEAPPERAIGPEPLTLFVIVGVLGTELTGR
ncbi:hypothetical protein ACFY8O_26850 [Streptomyces argenteolus]|uniref:Secreted protein with PEP-CTERM sorting signal n=1 Tax=Streptomyces argenteolus TaxID=67274 RepID=A0ABW6XCP9_9ACTN